MASPTVLVEGLGQPVARITLNRPERLNALSLEMVDELRAACEAVSRAGPRVVVLTGAGRAFCAGADLQNPFFEGENLGEGVSTAMLERYHPMVEALAALPCPTIAAVNGVAAGGGASLALLCDLVVSARSATFIQVFGPQLGLVPDLSATYTLPRLVGRARARGLALLGDRLDATTAEAWGLIWKAVDDGQLEAEVSALAARLAAGPTGAFQAIKRALDVSPGNTLTEQLEVERQEQRTLAAHPNLREAVMAFREKRKPCFT
jgi:2-(1,2-epoxy-1,2-dihydrophenyl)acetyl-CoA isomerase